MEEVKRYNKDGASYLISSPTEIRVYADRCLTCQESERLDVIRFQAQKHGLKMNLRRVYVLPELRAEADAYGVPMPFVALGNYTIDFFAVGKYLLKDEAMEQLINEVKNEHSNEN